VLKNILMRLKQFQGFISVYFTMCDGLYALTQIKSPLHSWNAGEEGRTGRSVDPLSKLKRKENFSNLYDP